MALVHGWDCRALVVTGKSKKTYHEGHLEVGESVGAQPIGLSAKHCQQLEVGVGAGLGSRVGLQGVSGHW